MSKKIAILCFLLTFMPFFLSAQHKYWVFLTDKDGVDFDPISYFDIKAIERRLLHNIPLNDITDYPLNKQYVKAVKEIADTLLQQSRWFNALAVYASPEAADKLLDLPFVDSISPINSRLQLASIEHNEVPEGASEMNPQQLAFLKNQTTHMNGNLFHEHNITGEGVRIAVFDAGFPSVDTHEAFAHIRDNKRIIKTWDFVRNRENVYRHSVHGTSVLSCIAGIYNEIPMGLATNAEFLLARTEMVLREPFSEEENWLAAAEWADKNGAHIINSSLGYLYHRYFPDNMDGRSSLVAQAAHMAARKGILVVNAAGNEGQSQWKIIGTPADADSVLSIGGINPDTDYKINFSSFGPTADGRMKPNVSAYAKTLVAQRKGTGISFGTSFSSPLVAGFAACALQTNKNLTNMQLFRAIEKSGHLYPYFDYAHGYGIPQADYFLKSSPEHETRATFDFQLVDNELTIKTITWDYSEFEKSDTQYNKKSISQSENNNTPRYLYYNIQNPDGSLNEYFLIDMLDSKSISINLENLSAGQIVNVIYNGYYDTFHIKK